MAPTSERPPAERTASIRGRAAAARPKITYAELASRAGYSRSYVGNVLSDNEQQKNLDDVLTALETALAELEAEQAQMREAA